MKDDIDASAAAKNISNTEWLRRAIQNEIEREVNGESDISGEGRKKELEQMIKQVLRESGYEVKE